MPYYSNEKDGEQLRGIKYAVLDNGFVCLIDWMGDDRSIATAARVSYRSEAKSVDEDARLIRYLMKHGHTSPFEMAELKFMLRIPMDSWRQMVRHRTASINERSTRYSVVDDSFAKTGPGSWRSQSGTNRQGSGHPLPLERGEILSADEQELHDILYRTYQNRINVGVAREQARKDLPLSTYTEAYWKIDLHNLLHFLGLRLAPDAQYEIRQYAGVIGRIVAKLFPITWDAFEVFCRNSIRFDQKECDVLRHLLPSFSQEMLDNAIKESGAGHWFEAGSRNRNEFEDKLHRLLP